MIRAFRTVFLEPGMSVRHAGIAALVIASVCHGDVSKDVEILRYAPATPESPRVPGHHTTGTVRLLGQFRREEPSRLAGAVVVFEPGSRTGWHSHPLGQTLIVTHGSGFVQHWGGKRESIRVGDVVWTPPGVKHWHGASPKESMTHVAIVETPDGNTVHWMEPVTDEQYGGE
jgi:quercetin dioxygenase-like cupin family protein